MDFRNIELKNLFPVKNKNILLSIGMVVFALIFAKYIYSSQIRKIETLKNDKDIELKKNDLINDIRLIEKRIDAYKQVLYKRDISSVINSITQVASSSQIKITSVRPEREREDPAYNEITISLSITADNYHKIGDFISRLENAPELYQIDHLTISPLVKELEGGKGLVDILSAELRVTTIVFKG